MSRLKLLQISPKVHGIINLWCSGDSFLYKGTGYVQNGDFKISFSENDRKPEVESTPPHARHKT